MDALAHSLRELAHEIVSRSPNLPNEAGNLLTQVKDTRYLAYLVAGDAGLDVPKAQEMFEAGIVKDDSTYLHYNPLWLDHIMIDGWLRKIQKLESINYVGLIVTIRIQNL